MILFGEKTASRDGTDPYYLGQEVIYFASRYFIIKLKPSKSCNRLGLPQMAAVGHKNARKSTVYILINAHSE